MTKTLIVSVAGLAMACSSRNYTYYLVEPAPQKTDVFRDDGAVAQPFGFGSTTAMKVRWNDGNLVTEVEVPLLASGQRVVIDHGEGSRDVKTLRASKVIPPPPTKADQVLIDAYRARGLRVDEEAPDVSITRARTLMQDAIKAGTYELALEWCETVLQRYKSHPEFLRAKASVLLLMGERDKAIEIYEQAEEVESDPQVRKKLEELQSESR